MVETTVTYPFEFLKTVTQLHKNNISGKSTSPLNLYNHQFKYYFSGCGALNIGNALKSGSRFIIFNSASKFMSTENGKTSAPRLVIAGAMTGFVESLWIIPFENIKTTMIENALHYSAKEGKKIKTNPQQQKPTPSNKQQQHKKKTFHNSKSSPPKSFAPETLHPYIIAKQKWDALPSSNFITSVQEIHQTRGFRGFLQGTVPTLIRQCSNSAVRFGTYTSLRQLVQPHGGELNPYMAFGIGVLSSIAVVAVTQPIDVIKTRMQSRDAYYNYTNSLNCAYRIFIQEGLKSFWSGWSYRLAKVATSGGVAFTVYQTVENQITRALKEQPFQPA